MLDGQRRPERHGIEHREHGRVGANAESECDDDGRRDEGVTAQNAPGIAEVAEDHACVLLWRLGENTRQGLEPQAGAVPRTAGRAIAIDEDQRQLTAIFVTECGRVEREQRPERALALTFAGRHYSRHQSRPAREQAGRTRITQQTLQTARFRFRDSAPERRQADSTGAARRRAPGPAARRALQSARVRAAVGWTRRGCSG